MCAEPVRQYHFSIRIRCRGFRDPPWAKRSWRGPENPGLPTLRIASHLPHDCGRPKPPLRHLMHCIDEIPAVISHSRAPWLKHALLWSDICWPLMCQRKPHLSPTTEAPPCSTYCRATNACLPWGGSRSTHLATHRPLRSCTVRTAFRKLLLARPSSAGVRWSAIEEAYTSFRARCRRSIGMLWSDKRLPAHTGAAKGKTASADENCKGATLKSTVR